MAEDLFPQKIPLTQGTYQKDPHETSISTE